MRIALVRAAWHLLSRSRRAKKRPGGIVMVSSTGGLRHEDSSARLGWPTSHYTRRVASLPKFVAPAGRLNGLQFASEHSNPGTIARSAHAIISQQKRLGLGQKLVTRSSVRRNPPGKCKRHRDPRGRECRAEVDQLAPRN